MRISALSNSNNYGRINQVQDQKQNQPNFKAQLSPVTKDLIKNRMHNLSLGELLVKKAQEIKLWGDANTTVHTITEHHQGKHISLYNSKICDYFERHKNSDNKFLKKTAKFVLNTKEGGAGPRIEGFYGYNDQFSEAFLRLKESAFNDVEEYLFKNVFSDFVYEREQGTKEVAVKMLNEVKGLLSPTSSKKFEKIVYKPAIEFIDKYEAKHQEIMGQFLSL